MSKKNQYEYKQPYKYLSEHLDGWNFLNSTLMALCKLDGAIPSVEDDVLVVELRCGIIVKVENFLDNKEVQPTLDFSKCYKKPFVACKHPMGFNCFDCELMV